MKNTVPKQFLELGNKCIALYSFDLFLSLPEIDEIVIVCDQSFRTLFQNDSSKKIAFADPGSRRQDSVFSGLQAITCKKNLICIHDSARPFITRKLVRRVVQAAQVNHAATSGMPVKFTVKECNENQFVINTPNRTNIWEIQTPQVIDYALLTEGFAKCHAENLTVTDDVSLIELLNQQVSLVEGSYANLKITTQEDFIFSQSYIHFPGALDSDG